MPFEAKKILIDEFTRLWDTPAAVCFEKVASNAQDTLERLVNKHFGRFPKLRAYILYVVIRRYDCERYDSRADIVSPIHSNLVLDIFVTQKNNALAAITATLAQEKYPLFTMNDHYLIATREKWLLRYKDVRRQEQKFAVDGPLSPNKHVWGQVQERPKGREKSNGLCITSLVSSRLCLMSFSYTSAGFAQREETPMDRALQALRELGYTDLRESDLIRLNPPDTYEEELNVMADVRAYFQVAYKVKEDSVTLSLFLFISASEDYR